MPLLAPGLIDAERVFLRLVRREDLPALMGMNGDPRVTDFLPYQTWLSEADALAWFERMESMREAGLALQFVVVEKASSDPIGTCLVFRYEEGSQRAELGYALARSRWDHGFMTEALRALLSHLFSEMKIRRLEAEVNPDNQASVRLLARLGFQHEGLLRQRWVAKGAAYDVSIFGLLAHEFPGAAAASGV